jgi:hypothetical protein
MLANAGLQLHANDLRRLVRLDVWPQPLRAAGQVDGAGDVLADEILIEEESRAEDAGHIADRIFRKHGSFSPIEVQD